MSNPCPDCAHTDHPGRYVGLRGVEICRTCDGSALAYDWRSVVDTKCLPGIAGVCETRPFADDERANLKVGQLVAFRDRLRGANGRFAGGTISLFGTNGSVLVWVTHVGTSALSRPTTRPASVDELVYWNGVPPTENT